MNGLLTIASFSVMEHARKKVIIFFVAVSVLVTLALLYLELNPNDSMALFGPIEDIARFASIGILGSIGALAALAVSMGNIGQPFSSGEASLILARPVTRIQFAAGRLLASATIVSALCLLVALETQAVNLIGGSGFSADLWGHWGIQAFNLVLLVIVTTLLSVLISTPVIAAIVAFMIMQALGGISLAHRLVEVGEVSGNLSSFLELAWWVTPKQLTSPWLVEGLDQASANGMLLRRDSAWMVLWAIAYAIGLVGAILLLVRKKEVS